MLQFSLLKKKTDFLKIRYLFTAFTIGALCSAALPVYAANMINAITTESSESGYTVHIRGNAEPAYTAYELFNPQRVVIDIADAALQNDKNFTLKADIPFSLATSTVEEADPSLTRLEFTFDKKQNYKGYNVKVENNAIVLAVNMEKSGSMGGSNGIASQMPKVNLTSDAATTASTENDAPAGKSLGKNFSFGGYNNQRITVDFYKIDLHNVFRLIREVSKMNIVVDEAVSGSLTLALNDVPWDFALDIILNLKDLQKEERYNTIVILPKSKEFSWPERAQDNLQFVADENVVSQEAIVIQQQMNIPPEVAEAKKIIQDGRTNEKKGNYETAIQAYTDAFAKWPDNDRLANKISSIYLVYLRQNAKAVYYAKQALQINDQNANAALNAAIGLANMHEFQQAQQYFDQSVNAEKPSREALLSYAVFAEEQEQFDSAVTLLQKVEDMYGPTLDSMVAYARVLDKQGKTEAATEKYKSILLSGYQIPPDLKKYLKSRIALNLSK